MTCYRIYGDADGETHLVPLALMTKDSPIGLIASTGDVPTTTASLAELSGAKPGGELHRPPRRQFVVVLRGALEIETTLGSRQRLECGDVLLADDGDAKGHITRDVGDESLSLLTVGIDDAWAAPHL